MVNSHRGHRAKRFDVSTSCLAWLVSGSEACSVAITGASARDQTANERPHNEGDADGLIRMFMHGLIGGLGTLNGLVSNAAIDLFAVFQCGGETLAGFADFFLGHIGGSGYQGTRIFGERA
jgi:hypothetical protein